MQYQNEDKAKLELRPQLRRVLENLELRFNTKFTDLVLSAWVQVLSNIPDEYLIITTLYVSATCSDLPTPYQFLEMYRDWETDRKSTRLNSSH